MPAILVTRGMDMKRIIKKCRAEDEERHKYISYLCDLGFFSMVKKMLLKIVVEDILTLQKVEVMYFAKTPLSE
jgi:hypothetical protein